MKKITEMPIPIVNSNLLNNFLCLNMLKPISMLTSFRKSKEKKKKSSHAGTPQTPLNIPSSIPFPSSPFFPMVYSDKIERVNTVHSFILFEKKILKKIKNMEESLHEIQHETFFYRFLHNTKYTKCFPHIYKIYDMGLLMEQKDCTLFHLCYPSNQILLYPFIEKIFEKISILHSATQKVVPSLFFYDLKLEIFDPVYKIVECYFSMTPSSIHNVPILHPREIVEKCKRRILQYYSTIQEYEYSIIHGDLLLSHIVTDIQGKDVHFISPRGHFGNTKYYGIREFDISRLLFSLQGYDMIRNSSVEYDNVFEHDIYALSFLSSLKKGFPEWYERYFHKIHEIWSVIHWFRAASSFTKHSYLSLLCYHCALYYGSII